MPRLDIVDWITPNALVLSLVGELDAPACRQVGRRLHELLRTCPDILVTLDLSSVSAVDVEATEELFIGVVAMRARGGSLIIARPSAACQTVLRRLNLEYLPHIPTDLVLAGVTA
jgi:anti-anti-sigma regulatory factor